EGPRLVEAEPSHEHIAREDERREDERVLPAARRADQNRSKREKRIASTRPIPVHTTRPSSEPRTSQSDAPWTEISRSASFRNVSGSRFVIGRMSAGAASFEKNTPEKKNCGRVMSWAIAGTWFSVSAHPASAKPSVRKSTEPSRHTRSRGLMPPRRCAADRQP